MKTYQIKLSILTLFISSAAFAQSPLSFSKKVKTMPEAYVKPIPETQIYNEGKSGDLPWIVFSDRKENYTYTSPGGSLVMKSLNFMEPFYVSDEKNGFLKLIKYQPGMVKGRKLVQKKTAQSYGWIAKSKMLLWQSAYSDKKTGYPLKAISIINGSTPFSYAKYYYDKTDSMYVYDSPELKSKLGKVRLHQLIYVLKATEDGKKMLLGSSSQLVTDKAAADAIGWVAADAVHFWGSRLYISPVNTRTYASNDSISASVNQNLTAKGVSVPAGGIYHADPILAPNEPVLRSMPVLDYNGKNQPIVVGLANDVYDKSKNSLLNIKGGRLTYQRYLDLRKNSRNINVVFVVDGGSPMKSYFSALVNSIQTFEDTFNKYGNDVDYKFGAVVYRAPGSCNGGGNAQVPLNGDYRNVVRFLTSQIDVTESCNSETTNQPVEEGVRSALNLLSAHADETNLVILLGSTGNDEGSFEEQYVSNAIANAGARMLAIQVYSDFEPTYNNFVIQARRMVSLSATGLAERKKQVMVRGEGLSRIQPFNTAISDSISFYLDYPQNSLVQGAVVFPAKGMVKSNQDMEMALARILEQTKHDINYQTTTLDSAFRLTGRERLKVNPVVVDQLGSNITPDMGNSMPHNAFKYYMTANLNPALMNSNNGLLQYSILLNEMEYKQFTDVLGMMIGENLQQDASNFRRKLFKNYVSIVNDNMSMDMSRGDIKKLSLSQYFTKVTGLPIDNMQLDKYKVVDLKRDSRMPQSSFESYLKYLIDSRNALQEATRVSQQFMSNGKTYYYITSSNWKSAVAPKVVAQAGK